MGIIGVEGAIGIVDCADVDDVAVVVIEGDAMVTFDTAGVDCCEIHAPFTRASAKSFFGAGFTSVP